MGIQEVVKDRFYNVWDSIYLSIIFNLANVFLLFLTHQIANVCKMLERTLVGSVLSHTDWPIDR